MAVKAGSDAKGPFFQVSGKGKKFRYKKGDTQSRGLAKGQAKLAERNARRK